MDEKQAQQLMDELEVFKRIKTLELLERGYSQAEVAQILGTSQPSVSRMFPAGFKVRHG